MDRKVSDLLLSKTRPLVTVQPTATLRKATELMCEHRIGALPVIDARGLLIGLISERDLMHQLLRRVDFDVVDIEQAMTRRVIVGVEDDTLTFTMKAMSEARIRHLPIMRGRELVGIISIGDVVNTIRKEEEREVRYLTEYIHGR